MPYAAHVRRLATPLFRHVVGRRAALHLASRRGRSLVLLYHRVLPDGARPTEIVPSVPRQLFRQHLDALLQLGDIVPVATLLEPPRVGARPRFAVTFDDDCPGYVSTVLPELRALGVTATFFLSGRGLHGLPPYWWTAVEQSLRSRGLEQTRRTLGLSARTATDLALAMEQSPRAAELASRLPPCEERPLAAADIGTLARAGMTIGFHTLHHPILSTLAETELDTALTVGRLELAAASGRPVDLLAYPHGRASPRVARAVERAGYSAAFATGGRPIVRSSDRFLLARWEPGPLDADELGASVALRLLRAPTPSRAA